MFSLGGGSIVSSIRVWQKNHFLDEMTRQNLKSGSNYRDESPKHEQIRHRQFR